MKLVVASIMFGTSILSQTSDSTGPAITKAACSPANTGHHNKFIIKCGIGKEQGDQMLKILNKILAHQLDSDLVNAKLDQIIAEIRDSSRMPVITYSWQGWKVVRSPGLTNSIGPVDKEAWASMNDLAIAGKWQELASLCDAKRNQYPEWLAPWIIGAHAYLNLNNKQKARELIDHAKQFVVQGDDTQCPKACWGILRAVEDGLP